MIGYDRVAKRKTLPMGHAPEPCSWTVHLPIATLSSPPPLSLPPFPGSIASLGTERDDGVWLAEYGLVKIFLRPRLLLVFWPDRTHQCLAFRCGRHSHSTFTPNKPNPHSQVSLMVALSGRTPCHMAPPHPTPCHMAPPHPTPPPPAKRAMCHLLSPHPPGP